MIIEERIYTLYPGKVPAYLALYQSEGMALQTKILGNLIGYFSTDVGPLNQVVHLWGYADFDDRTTRRAQLAATAEWQTFLPKLLAFVVTMENRILLPAAFSPIR